MKSILFFLTLFLLLWPDVMQARPVSYPGGWTLMVMNDKEVNSAHVHYTPDPKSSIGLRHEYFRNSSTHADTLQYNRLLVRRNKKASQANLYLKSGIGTAYDNDGLKPAAFTGLATDWEDRRYFISYKNRFFWSDTDEKFVKHKARLGWAPYEGDFGDLHSWFMVEFNYDAGRDDRFSVTPLVRFFKGSDLLEAGYNFDDGVLFNYVHRF